MTFPQISLYYFLKCYTLDTVIFKTNYQITKTINGLKVIKYF